MRPSIYMVKFCWIFIMTRCMLIFYRLRWVCFILRYSHYNAIYTYSFCSEAWIFELDYHQDSWRNWSGRYWMRLFWNCMGWVTSEDGMGWIEIINGGCVWDICETLAYWSVRLDWDHEWKLFRCFMRGVWHIGGWAREVDNEWRIFRGCLWSIRPIGGCAGMDWDNEWRLFRGCMWGVGHIGGWAWRD